MAWTKRLRRGMGKCLTWFFERRNSSLGELRLIPLDFRPLWSEFFGPMHERVSQ
jgi:hypothetical protein